MKTRKDLLDWLEENSTTFIQMADEIWANPETAWKEFHASHLQMQFLSEEGFQITADVAGIPTAFIAEWGEGEPLLGFIGEYDALPGLSQKASPYREAVTENGAGHGCGHNLLGTGCLAAAVALKNWLEANEKEATIRYYGCPAEEGGGAKAFMARAGVFDDLDAAFNFHPSALNYPCEGSNLSVNHIRFRFHGQAAHAGGAPHLGRSALDAVELMNVGVNYLREHVTDDVRIHYVITRGGAAPNIVPDEAEVWYYVRAHLPADMQAVTERVRKVAQGAALMTETTWEEIFESATTCILNNQVLSALQYRAMEEIGPIQYTPEEKNFARAICRQFPTRSIAEILHSLNIPPDIQARLGKYDGEPLIGENFPALDRGVISTGSTDVGEVSWITPLCMLYITCWAIGVPSHSWGVTAFTGTSIGHKGMLHAAKIMAISAVDLIEKPELLRQARDEFLQKTRQQPYRSPIPPDVQPPINFRA